MGQARSSPVMSSSAAALSPEQNVSTWRDKLRAAGRRCPLANYRDVKFEDVCGGNAALLSLVEELGASTPTCVYFGQVAKAQANLELGRLSLAGGHRARHIVEALTDRELDRVIDDGLEVPVLDGEGRRYHFRCCYAQGTRFYRLVGAGEYKRFMLNNDLVRDVAELGKTMLIKVFALRSPALRPKDRVEDDDHPDGALGLIVLFFDLDADGATFGNELLDVDTLTLNQIMKFYPKAPEGYTLV
ncbi:hypothetical protein ABZP36_013115 [Zizania latifolia]